MITDFIFYRARHFFFVDEELSEQHEELSEYKIKNPLYLCRTLSSCPFSGI